MNNKASRHGPRLNIRAPPNSATAQLFRARHQHRQVGEVATHRYCHLVLLATTRSTCCLSHTHGTKADFGHEPPRTNVAHQAARSTDCEVDKLQNLGRGVSAATSRTLNATNQNKISFLSNYTTAPLTLSI